MLYKYNDKLVKVSLVRKKPYENWRNIKKESSECNEYEKLKATWELNKVMEQWQKKIQIIVML